MDVTKLLESEYLSVQIVNESPSKTGVILSAGTEQPSKDGSYKSLQVLIEIDGKNKLWRINRVSLKALSDKFGKQSEAFIGKAVCFSVVKQSNGKDGVLGNPV
jgi:hypothetical protein